MLVFSFLVIVLTISHAKANPILTACLDGRDPRAFGEGGMCETFETSAASSLTIRETLKTRACLDQFVWYCAFPAGSCLKEISSASIWTLPSCIIAAACAGVTVLLGALCCNGIIKNCASIQAVAESKGTLSTSVFDDINDGNSITKQSFKDYFYGEFTKLGAGSYPTSDEYDSMWSSFTYEVNCWDSGSGGSSNCEGKSPITYSAFNDYLHLD